MLQMILILNLWEKPLELSILQTVEKLLLNKWKKDFAMIITLRILMKNKLRSCLKNLEAVQMEK